MDISKFSLFLAVSIGTVSFLGMAVIIIRKLPLLKQVGRPEEPSDDFLSQVKYLLRRLPVALKAEKIFESGWRNLFFQKILSRTTILALKVERKTGEMLKQAREAAKRREEGKAYWQKLSKLQIGRKKK